MSHKHIADAMHHRRTTTVPACIPRKDEGRWEIDQGKKWRRIATSSTRYNGSDEHRHVDQKTKNWRCNCIATRSEGYIGDALHRHYQRTGQQRPGLRDADALRHR